MTKNEKSLLWLKTGMIWRLDLTAKNRIRDGIGNRLMLQYPIKIRTRDGTRGELTISSHLLKLEQRDGITNFQRTDRVMWSKGPWPLFRYQSTYTNHACNEIILLPILSWFNPSNGLTDKSSKTRIHSSLSQLSYLLRPLPHKIQLLSSSRLWNGIHVGIRNECDE